MILKIRNELIRNSEEEYRKFIQKLIPNQNNILGVRVGKLRKIAKDILKNEFWKEYILFENMEYNEEILLQGIIIGYSKISYQEKLEYIEKFIKRIDNWMVCDTFCGDLKIVKSNKREFLKFLKKYYKSSEVYEIRFSLVIFLKYYLEKQYLNLIFEVLEKIKSKEYYVEMAAGWLLAELYFKFPYETKKFLYKMSISSEIFKNAKRKIKESTKIKV